MATLSTKTTTDDQDIGGVYKTASCINQNNPAEIPTQPPSDTPIPPWWCDANCGEVVSGTGGIAVSVVTPLAVEGTPSTGFHHQNGIGGTVDVYFPNTIAGSTDYASPQVSDNADGTITITFVDGTTRDVNICGVIATNCNTDLTYDGPNSRFTFTDNAGTNKILDIDIVSQDGDNIINIGTDGGALLTCAEILDCGGTAPEVNVNASAAGNQIAFDALMPSDFPDGYEQIHIYVDPGSSTFTLDNFISIYGKPTNGTPSVYIHNVSGSTGELTTTMPKTGTVRSWSADDIVSLSCDHLGNWTIIG